MNKITFIISAIVTLLFSSMTFADCVDGIRKETPQEAVKVIVSQEEIWKLLPRAYCGFGFQVFLAASTFLRR